MKIFNIRILIILLASSLVNGAEPLPAQKRDLSKPSAFDPILNRARGYMSKGELQFATHNYGSFIEFESYSSPSGLYKGYQYISDVSFILGVPGKLPDSSFAPWAMRPEYSGEYFEEDTLVYWGSTVTESWFDRIDGKKQADWESVEGHFGTLHSGDVLAGEVYGGLYTDTGDPYPLLATSDIPDTWPLVIDTETGFETRTWPGDWAVVTDPSSPQFGEEIFGRHIGDQDIYMEFDDRLATREEDKTQGYPMGIHVKVNAHSYGRSYAEDIAFFTVEIINESYKGFPLDLNGDGEPDQTWVPITLADGSVVSSWEPLNFVGTSSELPDGGHLGYDYTEAYGGFYFDVDSYSRQENGSYTGRSNDDDMMAYDQDFDMAFIWDWNDDSNGADNLAYSALKLLDTPNASRDLDLDGNGSIDVLQGESLGLTDWHWFDWYVRPGVTADENSGGSCPGGGYAGSGGCPGSEDKENIMYALMAGDTSYVGVSNNNYSDWDWRDLEADGPNVAYDQWYFHPDGSGNINPHFDSPEGLLQEFPNGLDCVFIMSAGPFDLEIGDTTFFSFAVIMGDPPADTENFDTPPDLARNAEMAQIMYDLRYQGFSPPDAPTVSGVGSDEMVTLYWDSKAEYSKDIVTDVEDFEGYKIYKSTDGGLTWGDPASDIVYNTDGQAVGWKPLAQFDHTEDFDIAHRGGNDYSGDDPIAPWFKFGSGTGLEHRYVDTDVLNGVTYSYSVVAYDIGIDSLDDYTSKNGEWKFSLEYLENFKGNSPLLPQFVSVTPDARPSNAPDAQGPVPAPWNQGNGILEVLPADINALQGASGLYKIVVDADSTWVGPVYPSNPATIQNATYSIYSLDTGDTIVGWVYKLDGSVDTSATQIAQRTPIAFTDGTIFGDPWAGFLLFSENLAEAEFDTLNWINHSPTDSPTWDITVNSSLALRYKYAVDYDFIWGLPDTAQNGGRVMPFSIKNLTTDEFIDFKITYSGNDGLAIYDEFPDFKNRTKVTFWENGVPGYNSDTLRFKASWLLTISWTPDSLTSNIHYEYPTIDTMRMTTKKPFRKGDEFTFDASSITVMKEVAKEHVEAVLVVPNPYIVSADWETDINHKSLHFTHLPDECVIRIFTLTGELVFTLLHNDIFSGQEEWNLRSMNRQEVAPGLYIFVVETPNNKSYTGKFAV
ncbi:hypothetical protein HQ531_10240, partial [bacterium]|nr:hypothetical protein [bacterium]